jgi:elongation factor Ts
MGEISAAQVKELREATNVGMMECKKALEEAGGDREKAIKFLRERGLAVAGKKASRAVKSGLIAAGSFDDGRTGVMIEVNCETDFVARNDNFQRFVAQMLERARDVDGELAARVQDDVAAKIAEIGENIVVRRNIRFAAQGPGAIGCYIHLGSKVGVMVELGCGRAETASAAGFRDLLKDLTLHVAACSPSFLDRAAVPAEVQAAERAIYAKQVQNKPPPIVDKIVAGKLEKYFALACFVEQAFVKDPDTSVAKLLAARGKELGDSLAIRRFVRYQLGEEN